MKNRNIILNQQVKSDFEFEINELFRTVPDMMTRKISEANIQQAWMLSMIKRHGKPHQDILCVGAHEDTCAHALILQDWNIHCIDPLYNYDLNQYLHIQNRPNSFDIVFSTSVIEHVKDDSKFLSQMCQLLKPNGFGFLTCDFNNDYPRVPKPVVDERLYTLYDLTVRFPLILEDHQCRVYGTVDYSGLIDFEYENCQYGFATFTFVKESMWQDIPLHTI